MMDLRNLIGGLVLALALIGLGFCAGTRWQSGDFAQRELALKAEIAAKDKQHKDEVAAAVAQERGLQAGSEAMAAEADRRSLDAVGAVLAAATSGTVCTATDGDIEAMNVLLKRVSP